jgi:hypothetical protein
MQMVWLAGQQLGLVEGDEGDGLGDLVGIARQPAQAAMARSNKAYRVIGLGRPWVYQKMAS